MKAKPQKLIPGDGYIDCEVSEATHVKLNLPGPTSITVLPIIIKGSRSGTGCWTWNGDTDKPTLKPSLLCRMGRDGGIICHTFINDGQVQFLPDSTHEFAGQTLDLLEIQ